LALYTPTEVRELGNLKLRARIGDRILLHPRWVASTSKTWCTKLRRGSFFWQGVADLSGEAADLGDQSVRTELPFNTGQHGALDGHLRVPWTVAQLVEAESPLHRQTAARPSAQQAAHPDSHPEVLSVF